MCISISEKCSLTNLVSDHCLSTFLSYTSHRMLHIICCRKVETLVRLGKKTIRPACNDVVKEVSRSALHASGVPSHPDSGSRKWQERASGRLLRSRISYVARATASSGCVLTPSSDDVCPRMAAYLPVTCSLVQLCVVVA